MSATRAELQLRYLQRMGIEVWQQRRLPPPAAAASEPAVAELAVTAERPVAATAPLAWETLAAEVAGCRRCGLHTTRTQTVFGVGDRSSPLLVVGEAPGADEDRQGEPFVGRAGQLLNLMLKAMGWPRDKVYIANLLKCRPPGNRDPQLDEVAACRPFLQRQIELVQPRVMLALGRQAAQHLLQSTAPLAQLRGRVLHYGEHGIPLVVTYHPAYLLRSPHDKARAWQDLKLLRTLLADEGQHERGAV